MLPGVDLIALFYKLNTHNSLIYFLDPEVQQKEHDSSPKVKKKKLRGDKKNLIHDLHHRLRTFFAYGPNVI